MPTVHHGCFHFRVYIAEVEAYEPGAKDGNNHSEGEGPGGTRRFHCRLHPARCSSRLRLREALQRLHADGAMLDAADMPEYVHNEIGLLPNGTTRNVEIEDLIRRISPA